MTTDQLTMTVGFDGLFADGRAAGRLHRPQRVQAFVKHAVDRIGAGVLLLALLPVMVVVALAVRLTSPGPAIYRQVRVGLDGQTFTLWKFRTMVQDADFWLPDLLHRHNRHDVPLFKVPDDPRITAVGRWLRKFSLDELPQLVNIVQGRMSLVGPRPQRPAEVALYGPVEMQRLRVRPGLTGLWQVSGRSALSWDDAVALDLHYISDWSLLADIRILLRTPLVVLRGDGAC